MRFTELARGSTQELGTVGATVVSGSYVDGGRIRSAKEKNMGDFRRGLSPRGMRVGWDGCDSGI